MPRALPSAYDYEYKKGMFVFEWTAEQRAVTAEHLGELVMAGGALEHAYRDLAAALLHREDTDPAVAKTPPARLAKILIRASHEELSEDLAREIELAVREARRVGRERNDLVHAPWPYSLRIHPRHIAVRVAMLGPDTFLGTMLPASHQRIARVIADIEQATQRLLHLSMIVANQFVGRMIELQRGPSALEVDPFKDWPEGKSLILWV